MTTHTRFPDDVPTLTDGTVTLRAHRPSDVPAVVEQCTDPLSVRWTTVPVPYSVEQAEGFVGDVVRRGWEDGSVSAFAVEALDDDGTPRFCGTVELRDLGSKRAEIAYGTHPWARGRGIMQRALNLLLDWGFEDQGLRVVLWMANVGNWASRRTAWRLGFTCDGTLPRWLAHRDELHWFGSMPSPYTLDDAHAYLVTRGEKPAEGTGVGWAVADPATDELIGAISLFDVKPGREAEVGYWAHPDARGRGVMTQACGLAVRHGFTTLGLVRLLVYAAVGNTASRHVIEANGFTRTGTERSSTLLRDGSLVDTACYDQLVEEWLGREPHAG